jgi:hypothetical protein
MQKVLSNLKVWITKNKVFVAGLLASITMVLQQALLTNEMSIKALGFAVFISVIAYIGNAWKGQGLSLTGIIGTVAFNFSTIQESGKFTWNEFLLTTVLALLLVAIDKLNPQKERTSPDDRVRKFFKQ